MILIPMPEALTRTNALLSGQVDLIERRRQMLCRSSRPPE